MAGTLRIGMVMNARAAWLGADALRQANQALSAHEDHQFLEAVGRAGAFLEHLLVRTLQGWSVPLDERPTLGQLIGAMRKSNRAPDALLERLNEAVTIRNRIHPAAAPSPADSGDPDAARRLREITEADSLQMLTIVALVADWVSARRGAETAPLPEDLLPVFLSVGGVHRLDQEQFMQCLRAEMRILGVDLRVVPPDAFSTNAPFDQIHGVIAACRAALVVGLERRHAYAVFERERSDDERILYEQFTSTGWNHIEGAIASALKIPVLVLREDHIHAEGIFEARNHRHQIREFDLSKECRGLSAGFREYLASWVQHVRTVASPAP